MVNDEKDEHKREMDQHNTESIRNTKAQIKI